SRRPFRFRELGESRCPLVSSGLGSPAAVAERERSAIRRTLTAIVSFLIVATACALAGSDTNEFTLLKHQARRQAYEWRVSEARILATPEWSIDATNAPVAPERAWKIAKDWFKKKDRG